MSLIVDEHRLYLSDPVRLDAFRRAIHESVHAGDVVVDLGSGTGILGLMACEAGARRVYAIETGGIIEVARAVARSNRCADRIVFINELSTLATLPEPADVVVSDLIGHFGFEIGLWNYLADARQRFLRPGGRLIPSAVSMIVAPVESPELHAQVEFWAGAPAGFDFSAARAWAANTGYPARLPPAALLGGGVTIARADMQTITAVPLLAKGSAIVERAGVLHGIGGWFEAQLSPGVTLTNSPVAAQRLGRRNVFLPVDRPVAVAPGTAVEVSLHIDPLAEMLTWSVDVAGPQGDLQRFRHSTFNGMLISPGELRRMHPGSRPVLTERGVARRTVLELCDGARTLRDVERGVYERHPQLFASEGEASVFVAEVVTRYTE